LVCFGKKKCCGEKLGRRRIEEAVRPTGGYERRGKEKKRPTGKEKGGSHLTQQERKLIRLKKPPLARGKDQGNELQGQTGKRTIEKGGKDRQ